LADLIRVEIEIAEALVTVQKYIKYTTGRKATEMEIANTLKSYFILNEICNQIKYLRDKTDSPAASSPSNPKGPIWTMNLIGASSKDNLAKAGLFSQCIQEGIQTTTDFVEKTTGEKPTIAELAQSLKSTFILSEIKNQIDWQRKNSKNAP
jgi:hypothetical protein